MNGPLLVSLLDLPPERIGEAAKASPDMCPYIAVFLLAGILLCLRLRPPEC